MISKITNIALVILLGAAVALWLSDCSAKRKLEEKIEGKQTEIQELHTYYIAYLDSCKAAKVVKDSIVVVERWYPGKVIEIPAAVDSVKVYQTIAETYKREYKGRIEFENLTAYYRAKTTGTLDQLEITSYAVTSEDHYSTAVITAPPPPQKPVVEYRYRRGWYLSAAAGNDLKSWTSWTSLEIGAGWMTRKGVAFGVDYQYLHDRPYSLVKIRASYFFGD